eukprot:558601-Pleurochrysis_carterae.AAC.1
MPHRIQHVCNLYFWHRGGECGRRLPLHNEAASVQPRLPLRAAMRAAAYERAASAAGEGAAAAAAAAASTSTEGVEADPPGVAVAASER